MRIDGNIPIDNKEIFNKVQESTGSKEVESKTDINRKSDDLDKITLSGRSKEISDLKIAIEQLPDIRTDKVEAIQKAIDTGNYNIDPTKIAEKMLLEL